MLVIVVVHVAKVRFASELWTSTGLLLVPPVIYEYEEARWNDTEMGKPKNLEKNLSQ
jgi:hypothetical protein